jgi:hypothetical protein
MWSVHCKLIGEAARLVDAGWLFPPDGARKCDAPLSDRRSYRRRSRPTEWCAPSPSLHDPNPDEPEPNRQSFALGRAGKLWMIRRFTSAQLFPRQRVKRIRTL